MQEKHLPHGRRFSSSDELIFMLETVTDNDQHTNAGVGGIAEEQQKLLLSFDLGGECVLKHLGNSNVTYPLCTENIHHIFRKSM